MALRRVLPSRATPEKSPESAAVPASQPSAPFSKSPHRPLAETHVVPPPAEVTYDMPNSAAENTPAPVATQIQSESFAAAAISAFGTLSTNAPARVLEDSFVKAEVTESVLSEPTLGPAALAESAYAAAEFSAPAWEFTPEPAPEPAEPESSAEPTLGPAAFADAAPTFSAPAWEGVNQVTSAPRETAAPEPEPVVIPAIVMAAPMSVAEEPAAPAVLEVPAPQVEPVAAPAQPASFQPSRPENNQFKRKVRDKKPRDLNAMGSPEDQRPAVNTPNTSFAPTVPVHTKSLEKVDEDLIATGIMEGPAADSLTGSLPTGVAEMTFAPPVQPAAQPAPALASIPITIPEPVAAPAPKPEPKPELITIPVPEPIQPKPALAPKAPEPVATPIPMPQPAPRPEPAPAASIPTPSFLSNAAPAPAATAPLPPPQSDLPWTQTATADWEIESPEADGWAPDTGHETHAAGASHMPPPADLYKGMGGSSVPPAMPASGLPPRAGTNFTPELPGQRKKSGGGSPWALVAIAVLVAAGGGAWYLLGKGGNQSQQQLASLTSPSASTTTSNGSLLPPPDVATPNTASASFYTPPSPASPNPVETSSSAVVAFADVPPEQANQPIVATGKEEIPSTMNLMDKFKAEVEKARAAKAGEAAGIPATASATAPTPALTATGAITPDKLQEELAAYRNALATSANPSALTPATFRKDPDGYMDGKPQQAASATPLGQTGTDGQMASGALLPPPDLYTNNPKNLPVVAEPAVSAPPRIRTLADFPDIQPYAPEREKVEIPKNLKPKMAATDFPALEVLSFVPGKGIVAYADGREGVLLIGESINGWELVNVAPDNAQFKAGQKSYQVTADN